MQAIEARHAQWKKLIEEQKTSGQSKAVFCKSKGINENSFYYYCDKLKREKEKNCISLENFVPIEIKGSSIVSVPSEASSVRLILKNGIECELSAGVSSERIREVVEVLLQC